MNPYRDKPAHQFWAQAVAWPAAAHIDPMAAGAKFKLNASDTVATMGSCFAQHISRELVGQGYAFLDAEPPPQDMPLQNRSAAGYGVFSARYGNVYTVRQALQLFQRAFGQLPQQDEQHVWPMTKVEGRFVDAFRPAIEPNGHATAQEVLQARQQHLQAVQAMFTGASVLVFTLGLTEAWLHKPTGMVYPLAPGVAGGQYSPELHQFVNFNVDEVRADLRTLVQSVLGVNAQAKIILTVSPVPLAATFEPRHVLQSNTYSKSVLRIAAGEVAQAFTQVEYFPSYEIITSPDLWGRYLEDDMRSVRPEGVAHVMRVFNKHFLPNTPTLASAADPQNAVDYSTVVCEEDLITESLKKSGY